MILLRFPGWPGPLRVVVAHLQLRVILQNPISVGGDSDRPNVNQLLVQPIAQYNFEQGWYASIGDFTWSFDWKSGGDATIPVALQVGHCKRGVGKRRYLSDP